MYVYKQILILKITLKFSIKFWVLLSRKFEKAKIELSLYLKKNDQVYPKKGEF